MPSQPQNQSTESTTKSPVQLQSKAMRFPQPDCPPADRLLRWITIISLVPALAFLIPHGVITHMVCPALGLAPQGLSACFGVFHIYRRLGTRGLDVVGDLFLAAFLISTLIPGWLFLVQNRAYYWKLSRTSATIVGSYGTVPLILNLCIHLYFIVRELYRREPFSWKLRSATCPRCQQELGGACTPSSTSSNGSYSPVDIKENKHADPRSSYHDPRPSTDDENARLV